MPTIHRTHLLHGGVVQMQVLGTIWWWRHCPHYLCATAVDQVCCISLHRHWPKWNRHPWTAASGKRFRKDCIAVISKSTITVSGERSFWWSLRNSKMRSYVYSGAFSWRCSKPRAQSWNRQQSRGLCRAGTHSVHYRKFRRRTSVFDAQEPPSSYRLWRRANLRSHREDQETVFHMLFGKALPKRHHHHHLEPAAVSEKVLVNSEWYCS